MKAKIEATLNACLIALAITSAIAQPQTKPSNNGAPANLARKLVRQCAGIKEGDKVFITGGIKDMALLEDIAVEVRKVGAHPLISVGSEKLSRRMYDEVPSKYDSHGSAFGLKLAGFVDAIINVDSGNPESILAGIPASRKAARAKAEQTTDKLALSRSIRFVGLGIGSGLTPTTERAKLFGISQKELARIYRDGVNADLAEVHANGESARNVLSSGKSIHITNPNGTDLNVSIADKPVSVSDGVISAEDRKRGGTHCQVWLPAGEVYLPVVPGTAEGTVVYDRLFIEGKEVQGMKVTFNAGKITSMSAKSGLATFKAIYDAAGKGRDELSLLDFGINPNVPIPPGSKMLTWITSGIVSIGFGNNIWVGGTNSAASGMGGPILGCTVTVDGKPLVTNGVLQK